MNWPREQSAKECLKVLNESGTAGAFLNQISSNFIHEIINEHRTEGVPIEKFQTSRGGGVGGVVGLERELDNFWLTFVLGMLGAGGHDVNNVNNVQCLITVSIGEKLSPGEETWVAASIPVHSYTDVRHSTVQRPMLDLHKKFSIRGQWGDIATDEENQPPSKAGDRTPDTETFSTTAATHPGEESATQSEPAAEPL